MAVEHNLGTGTEARLRTSVNLPIWMEQEIGQIAKRTFSSRSQVIRQLLGEALEGLRSRELAEVAS